MSDLLPFSVVESLRELGINLRTARERRGWRASDVAERAGVSRSTIGKIESGNSEGVAIGTIAKLLALYGAEEDLKRLCDPSNDSIALNTNLKSKRVRVNNRDLDNDF